MKILFALLALGAAVSVSAQVFRPAVANGAALGAVAGAIIGHNDGRHGWEGAAYGAAAGALLGAMVGEPRDDQWRHDTQVPVPRRPVFGPNVRRHHYPAPRGPGGWAGHDRGYRGGDYARRGAFWGGLTGAVIGHNDGRHGWEGAAYGVGAGWVLGGIIDRDVRGRGYGYGYDRGPRIRRQVRDYDEPVAVVYVNEPQPAAPAAAPQQVTIINNYYAAPTAMTSANGLFGR